MRISSAFGCEIIVLDDKSYGRGILGRRKEMMENKFKLGDMFTKKHTRDTIPLEIYKIDYGPIEPVYQLKPSRLCGNDVTLGEKALIELYNKIN